MMTKPNLRQRKWNNKLIIITLSFILFMLISQALLAKSLSLKTDRSEIEMGDIITLVLQTDFQTFDRPDLSVLKDQFEVLGQQTSSQISMVNGQFQALSRWDISITPKQSGELIIPPLTVEGVKSDPLPIKVHKLKSNPQDRGSSFLESSLQMSQAYVQQEVIFTLRFYFQGQLISGNIRPPQFGNALSEKIRNQVNYHKQIGNRMYEVFEWSWAFYPQKSGKLVIPAQNFDGRLQHQGRIKIIKDQSEPLTLTVVAKPDSFPANRLWLPAKQMSIEEQWKSDKTIRVGDSLTRHILLHAKGLQASQLPNLKLENGQNYHIYPGQTDNQNRKTDSGLISQKGLEVAIIPTQPGEMTLPEIQLPWWNTQTDKLETLVLPAKTLKILPALNQQILPETPLAQTVSHETNLTVSQPSIWQWISILVIVAWSLTLLLWWRQRLQLRQLQQSRSSMEVRNHQAWSAAPADMSHLCTEDDPKAFYRQLNLFLQQQKLKPSNPLNKAINQLTAHLYQHAPLDNQTLHAICNELDAQLKSSASSDSPSGKALAPLYPK